MSAPRPFVAPRALAALMVPVLLVVVVALAGTDSAVAQSAATRSGDVAIVSSADSSKPVTEGGSDTTFTLDLPEGAACPGDSANDNYRIQSFLIPATDDPGAIVWRSIGPAGDSQIALYNVDTNQYVQALTEINTAPGQPGIIPDPPQLSFATYAATDLQPGPHRMGIACTLYNTTTNYWDITVELTRDSSDQPAQIHWTATGSSAASAASSSSSSPWRGIAVVVVIVLAVIAIALIVLRRRTPTPTKESR